MLICGDSASLDQVLVDTHQSHNVATRNIFNGLYISAHHQNCPGEEREREREKREEEREEERKWNGWEGGRRGEGERRKEESRERRRAEKEGMGREKAGEKVTDVHFDPKSTVQVYCIASFPGSHTQ